jgi:DNA polymerase I-like protein with 3'-5' exonuclease and polymerase domains
VHDEVMLEGPKDSAPQALALVRAAMENPWANLMRYQPPPGTPGPLLVELAVDANIADTWYEAK